MLTGIGNKFNCAQPIDRMVGRLLYAVYSYDGIVGR